MATPSPVERPVDLMIDLRERMVRIETKLDIRVEKDIEIDAALADLKTRTTAIETQAVVLKTHIVSLRWIGGAAIAILATFGGTIADFLHFSH